MTKQNSLIGLIGLGQMGHGIAINIQQSGRQIALLEHTGNQPLIDLLENGAQSYTSLNKLATDCDVIIICVTGTPEVEQIVFSEDGVLSGVKPGTVVIDCSTSIPASSIKIQQAIAQAGALFMDAPMTRTPKEAAEGRLNLIVGADVDLFEAQLPLLHSFAENITLAGPVGSGHAMKLLHNFVSLGFSAVLAEAAASAESSGISSAVFLEVLAKGGGAGVILERLTPFIQSADDSSFRFTLENASKDMNYYVDMAQHNGAPTQTANSIKELYSLANDKTEMNTSVPHLVSFLSKVD